MIQKKMPKMFFDIQKKEEPKKPDQKKSEPEKTANENQAAEINLAEFRRMVEQHTTLEPHSFCSACSKCGGVFLHSLFRAGPWLCLSCWPPDSESWSDAPWMANAIEVSERLEPQIGFLRSEKLRQEFSSGNYWAITDRRSLAKQRQEIMRQQATTGEF